MVNLVVLLMSENRFYQWLFSLSEFSEAYFYFVYIKWPLSGEWLPIPTAADR